MSKSGSRSRMDSANSDSIAGAASAAPSADTAPVHSTRRSGLAAAASEARFRLMWGLASRLEPFIHMASRLAPSHAGKGGRQEQAKQSSIPRRWYISHILFWVGSGTACWLQFRRTDRTAARRHLLRSVWIPPLVWLAALTAIGSAIPDEAILDMVRNAPYNVRAP